MPAQVTVVVPVPGIQLGALLSPAAEPPPPAPPQLPQPQQQAQQPQPPAAPEPKAKTSLFGRSPSPAKKQSLPPPGALTPHGLCD